MGLTDQEQLLVRIGADISELKTGMRKAKDEIATFNKTIKSLQVGAAALVAGQKIVGFLKESAKEAAEAEAVTNKLTQALKLQGITSESTRDEILAYSSALQKQSVHGDEAITSVQTTLIQLGKLSGEGLQVATQATLDLASGLGIDLNSAALLVGKAAAGSTAAFSRYGLVVKATGDKGKDFQNVLGQISARFGGQAKTEAESYAGSVKQLQANFANLQEEIGKRLTPTLGTAATQWSKWITAFNSWAEADAAPVGKSFDAAADTASKLAAALAKLEAAGDGWKGTAYVLSAEEKKLIEQETGLAISTGLHNDHLAEQAVLIEAAIARNKRLSESKKLADVEDAAKNPPPVPRDAAADAEAEKARTAAAKAASEQRVAQADWEADQLMAAWGREADARESVEKLEFDKLFRIPAAGADELTLSLRYAEQALADLRTQMEAEREAGAIASPEELAAIERYKETIIALRIEIEKKDAVEKKGAEDKRASDAASRESMQQQMAVYQQLGDSVATVFQQVALEGEDMGEAVKNALRGIAMDLIRIAIARIIANAGVTGSNVAARDSTTGGIAGVATGIAAFAAIAALAGKIPSFHEGGKVGGSPGRDPTLIRAERGERVLSRAETADYETGGGRGGNVIHFNFSSVLPADEARLRDVLRTTIVPQLNQLARARMI